MSAALSGGFADPAIEGAHAFRAALEAMARPGTIRRVAGAAPPAPLSPAAGVLLLVLCDGTTPLHLAGAWDDGAVRDWVRFHTGAPPAPAGEAAFALGDWPSLLPLERFRAGTAEYPDRSATLIVEMGRLAPEGARLTGPGIREAAHLSLPEPLGPLRENAARYPLGVDLFLTCGAHLAALPRSTRIG
ncbi:phosphonate C-P lyase system protein PhnH [Rubellimicrobium sp. CFH 75288]|uniref:phosphonate C-P lyase system protein PhnH n=1 Tax=Rubellimicrobium sp. CFH 75288 TaxID=2697034 RepID=UPI0014122427|nr:phosphonate C-P lyase system protein PhnH [Rubellimicrobium sp. CFH 75288]NAZ36489.1 phosphonate C-P lyase system protein PhnH [Rubellimicrobium sp. CFH 75288]